MTCDAIALRLAGPFQAWGAPTTEDRRPTNPFPTRSGLVGLLGACLGVPYDERHRLVPISEAFRYVVRRDESPFEPAVLVDFQTVADVPTADGRSRTVTTDREYLLDTKFTAVLVATGEGAPTFDEIERALVAPHFIPVLGRKCCLPTEPLFVGRYRAEDPLELLDSLEPHRGFVWSEFEMPGAQVLRVRDVPSEGLWRFYTRTVHVFERS